MIIEFTVQSVRVYLRDYRFHTVGKHRCEKFLMSCSVWESREKLKETAGLNLTITVKDGGKDVDFPSKVFFTLRGLITQLNSDSDRL